MKKIIAAATAAIVGTLLLAPPASAGVQDDKLFYKLVTAEAPALKQVTRKQLVKTAKETCKFLRAGFGIMDAVDLAEDAGLTQNEATAMVAGAVVFYCPEQENNW
jgi:hypothetical protein